MSDSGSEDLEDQGPNLGVRHPACYIAITTSNSTYLAPS